MRRKVVFAGLNGELREGWEDRGPGQGNLRGSAAGFGTTGGRMRRASKQPPSTATHSGSAPRLRVERDHV